MRKLNNKLTMDEMLTGGVAVVTTIAEEALTRTAVAITKNTEKIVSTGKWGLAYAGLCVLDEHVNNIIVDGVIDVAQGITGSVTLAKGVGTVKSIVSDFQEVTDEEVTNFKAKLEALKDNAPAKTETK